MLITQLQPQPHLLGAQTPELIFPQISMPVQHMVLVGNHFNGAVKSGRYRDWSFEYFYSIVYDIIDFTGTLLPAHIEIRFEDGVARFKKDDKS